MNIAPIKLIGALFIILVIQTTSFSQESDKISQWHIMLNTGLQKHDKRLYDAPDKDRYLERTPERFGTWQFSLGIGRKVIDYENFSINTGIGVSTELATFARPFDHFYKNDGEDILVLLITDRYRKNLLQTPVGLVYKLHSNIAVNVEVLPQFSFFTSARNSNSKDINYSWWALDFYSLEFNPGLIFTINKVRIGLKSRIAQIKKIDRILYNRLLYDPRVNEKTESVNPFKIILSVAYEI